MRSLIALMIFGVAVVAALPGERIVGGYECRPNSKPYQASLNYGYHFCGGVLINDRWVLSVAHCWYNPYAMQIVLGEHSLRIVEGTEQVMKTDNIVWHPSYDYQTLDYDIMLIKLFHTVTVNSFVQPISLPRGCPTAGMDCSVSGWGNTLSSGVYLPLTLQCLDLPILSDADCEGSYPGMISTNMVCAGFLEGGKSPCNGDSGSPLVCNNEVHGLVSWGNGCAQKNHPVVHTKICSFLPWIQSTMELN
ncbi:trypsin-like [Acipenser oxyrinchus oxyrinchus]|uniref:trypsin n=1 Tax=Acipenser oxyrinchus oxyrinchus TaxID=40147 RepID=A0AAD8CKQ2_ACIOX|nr:trypsin-like [Acipenser oxyrinchus oxyrinchus]